MKELGKILEFNKSFVQDELYKNYETTKFPNKKIAVLSCMDTRLTELLPAAMGLKNGDAKIIKNAGGVISHPYGSAMRSLIVCVYQLEVEEIIVVGHHDCGMENLNIKEIVSKMLHSGVSKFALHQLMKSKKFHSWLKGFENVHESVLQTVNVIKNHPLIPKYVSISGLVIDPNTGKLEKIV